MRVRKQEINTSGEPLWTVAGATAAVAAIIALVTAFGLELTEVQITAILGFVATIAPTVVALLGRGKVVPADNVVVLRNRAGGEVTGPASPVADGTPVEVWPLRSDLDIV